MPDIEEIFADLGSNASRIPVEESEVVRPVTIRLGVDDLCLLDTLVSYTNLSRQAVLGRIVSAGTTTAVKAFLESAPDLEQDFENDYQSCVFERNS